MKVVEDSCYHRYFATLDSKKKLHIRILEKRGLGREVDLQVVVSCGEYKAGHPGTVQSGNSINLRRSRLSLP